MAKNKALADLGDTDLRERLGDAKEERCSLRYRLVRGRLETDAVLVQVKKEVARVLTGLRAREIDAAAALESAGGGVAD